MESDTRPYRISIITPSFNQAVFIERTIISVLSQGYPDLEYIIIDGGSTDGTSEIIKKYEHQLKWISEKDSGQSEAINKGLRMATGDIIAYLNSDDEYDGRSLFTVNDYFQTHPNSDWAYGKCNIIDENDHYQRAIITNYKNFLMRRYSFFKLLCTNFINQPSTFLRSSLLHKYGLINEHEHLAMDYEYWLRIGKNNTPGYIDQYLANFRMYSNSKSVANYKQQFRDEMRLAKSYSHGRLLATWIHAINFAFIVISYNILRALKK